MRPRNFCICRKLTTSVAGALLVFCLCGAARGVTVYMQDLGTDFVPTAGNALGDLVGYRLSTNQAALRHDNGLITNLGTLGGAQSRANAINNDGSVIVGWAHNATGVQNGFRFESGSLISVLGTSSTANQAVGLDSANNVFVNRQGGVPSVRRWNRLGGTFDTLLTDAQATGVNGDGNIAYLDTTLGTAKYYDGLSHTILPNGYNPVAGLSDSDLTAGSLGSLATYYRLGDATAQTIPGILALGGTSTATGVNDHDLVVGNASATVFQYSVTANILTDLNAGNFLGADAFYLTAVYGLTDADVFFGQYINFVGQQRYFRGSLEPIAFTTPGDFDTDGDVDGRDFLVWQRNSAAGNLADWQGNYGSGGLSALSQASRAVPEPGMALQVVWVLVLLAVQSAASQHLLRPLKSRLA